MESTNQPVAQPPSQQLPSDRNRRWLKWVLIVALVALISSGAMYIIAMSTTKQQPEQVGCIQDAKLCPDGSSVGRTGPNCEFSPCPNTNATSSAARPVPNGIGETANWKTYTNTKYHFSFKYPKEWQIGGAPNATVSDLSQSDIINLTSPCNYQAGDYCSQVDFKVGIYDPTFSDSSSGSKLLSKRMVEIDGVSSMERIYLSSYDNGAGKEPTRLNYSLVLVTGKSPQKNMIFINYIEQNKNVVMHTPDQWENKKTFDQILSTFTFD